MNSFKLPGLEHRLRVVEDKLAIYELIASHPPSADTGNARYTRLVYCEDGVFDHGPTLDGAKGAEEIAAFIQRPEHDEAIRGGLSHFTSLPLVDLRGDVAIVTSYLMIVHLDHEGVPRDLSNHGVSTGYRIHRTVVNRWELERCDSRWIIKKRTLLPVDGSDDHQELLSTGLNELHFSDLKDRRENVGDLESMLSDDEALEGIEAWLIQQERTIKMSSHGSVFAADELVESSAGWLLRLVQHARANLREE